ncbi:MAG: hypothetical protein HY904_01680 [Deltaproteobacteria bacterium]|nr:hypothetical protein [Deltaproteobacteria bacterium]
MDTAAAGAVTHEAQRLAAGLRGAGLFAELRATQSAALGWIPPTAGVCLVVEDRRRTVRYTRPYAELLPPGTAAEQTVHPRLSLHLFPLAAMSSSASMVTREQPASLEGATPLALVLVEQPAQSGDTADETLRAAVNAAVFGADADHGLLRAGRGDPHAARAVVESTMDGADLTVTVRPVPR